VQGHVDVATALGRRALTQRALQPAADDAGGALGAALALAHGAAGSARKSVADDAMQGAFLGPAFAQGDVEARLHAVGACFAVLADEGLNDACAAALERGEPIVCTPEDAFRRLMGSGIEWLAVGNCLLRKVDQDFARHGRGAAEHALRFAPD